MRTTQATLSSDRLGAKADLLRRSRDVDTLRAATERMAAILLARRTCVRITLGDDTIVIGDPTVFESDPIEFLFTSKKVLLRLFRCMRLINFAIAYFEGRLVIRGPISKAVDVLDALNLATDQQQTLAEFCWRLLDRSVKVLIPNYVRTNYVRTFESLDHYSQSAKAYELFLDDYMQYTCGRFEIGNEDINQAQLAKFRLIQRLATRYLGPLAGKDHLDIGCGWGGMGAYFQTQFGMRSLGNTNCPRQMEYAQRRYDAEIFYNDFSYLMRSERRFDLITIVGMIEHLTPYRRSQLLNIIGRLLKPGGIVYLQCITKPKIWIGGDAYRVAKRQIFPGHFLETSEQTETRLRNCGFMIVEQSDDRRDYALTTLRWVENIQKNEEALVSILGARQYRMYLGYLAFASRLFSIEGRGCLMRYVIKKCG